MPAGTVQAVANSVETKLKNAGFKVVDKYFTKDLAGHGVVVATDDAMLREVGASDGEWMKKIEMQENVAGLPYEVHVAGNEVGAPHGRFRIALAFPDVGMGQFMRISSLPNVIIETMSAVAGADKKSTTDSWQ